MNNLKKTASELILSALNGRKRPVSAAFLAERTGISLSTARTVLWQLAKFGDVTVVSTEETGERGRPANLYLAA